MKIINEDIIVGCTVKGEQIRADRLSKWVYNQLSYAGRMQYELENLLDIFVLHKDGKIDKQAIETHITHIRGLLAKAEGK